MHTDGVYCLKCKSPGCSNGEHAKYKFTYSHKLRPPVSIKNHARFRRFLEACPEFFNCIPPELAELLKDLLEEVGFLKTYDGEGMVRNMLDRVARRKESFADISNWGFREFLMRQVHTCSSKESEKILRSFVDTVLDPLDADAITALAQETLEHMPL